MAISNFEAIKLAEKRLEAAGIEPESIRFVFLERKNWTLTDWLTFMRKPINETDLEMLENDTEKLLQFIPPQYLLGFSEFCGRKLKVTKDTLIPRPETEELVMKALAIGDHDLPLNVVDIGTGTGAIALSIALECPQWKVWATDISVGALKTAQSNAKEYGAKILFDMGDIFSPFIFPARDKDDFEQFDLILSNPPYIAEDELDDMDESVKRYEPSSALFAADNGLAFYKRFATQAPLVLKKSGQALLEIGFRQGVAVKEIMQTAFPERKIEIVKDMAGQDRMIYIHAK